jgi:hypothetical protein
MNTTTVKPIIVKADPKLAGLQKQGKVYNKV